MSDTGKRPDPSSAVNHTRHPFDLDDDMRARVEEPDLAGTVEQLKTEALVHDSLRAEIRSPPSSAIHFRGADCTPAVKSSLVHPAYRTEYRVRHSREYEKGPRSRGDVTIRFSEEATANWISKSAGRRGGQRLCPDLAIETSLTLRTVLRLALRQTEGFVGSLLKVLGFDHLPAPDHGTLSR